MSTRTQKCSNDCGATIVWATTTRNERLPFDIEPVNLASDVWILRRGMGMLQVKDIDPDAVAKLVAAGITGWRRHFCPMWKPSSFGSIAGKIVDGQSSAR